MDTTALIADDDPELLDAVSAALEQSGMRVQRAVSGAELVQHLADERPYDLVITDVSMPWLSGLQAVVSARRAGLTMPIVVMTALQDAQIEQQLAKLDQNIVLLRKPFELDALLATVTSLVSHSK